jgi:hypothetical protein
MEYLSSPLEDVQLENPQKKKRGRRRKIDEPNHLSISSFSDESKINHNHNNIEKLTESTVENEVVSKKRGRKPKGGKLTIKPPDNNTATIQIANIILHLKCSLHDLCDYNTQLNKLVTNPHEYNPSIPPNILTYNDENTSQFSAYDKNDDSSFTETNAHTEEFHQTANIAYNESIYNSFTHVPNYLASNLPSNDYFVHPECGDKEKDVNIKDINSKLKQLKINLYKNQNHDKKSACFWCTYDYDNPPCYIPKYELDDTIYGYGSFCRPECAVAYLMKEGIDDSTKFERYHLLNQIYSKVYDFKKNIKPAPNPYYLLDKFYGNLSIQEYRKLLKTEHMLLVIEKPMTRILPELHENNEDITFSNYGNKISSGNNNTNNTGMYKVKRQSEKPQGPSKSSIMRDKFGMP